MNIMNARYRNSVLGSPGDKIFGVVYSARRDRSSECRENVEKDFDARCATSLILPSRRKRAMRRIVFVLCVLVAGQINGQTDRAHLLAKRAKTVHRNTCEGIDSAATCHHTFAEGCSSAKGTYDAYLSFLKNTTPSPRLVNSRIADTFTSLQDFQDLDNNASNLSGNEGPNAVALTFYRNPFRLFTNCFTRLAKHRIYARTKGQRYG